MNYAQLRAAAVTCKEKAVTPEDYTTHIVRAVTTMSRVTSKQGLSGKRADVAKAAPALLTWFGPPPTTHTHQWPSMMNIAKNYCASTSLGAANEKAIKAVNTQICELTQQLTQTEMAIAATRSARDRLIRELKKNLGVTSDY